MPLADANCMVRYASNEAELPAIRRGRSFFTPEGLKIPRPRAWRKMSPSAISELLKARGEMYIGDLNAPRRTIEQARRDAVTAILSDLGYTQVQLAALLDVNPRTVRRWVSGSVTVPRGVLILLLLAKEFHLSRWEIEFRLAGY